MRPDPSSRPARRTSLPAAATSWSSRASARSPRGRPLPRETGAARARSPAPRDAVSSGGCALEEVAERLAQELVEVEREKPIWPGEVAQVEEEEFALLARFVARTERALELPDVPSTRDDRLRFGF